MDCTSEWLYGLHLEIHLPDVSTQCTEGLIAAQALYVFHVRSHSKKMSIGVPITNRPVWSCYSYFFQLYYFFQCCADCSNRGIKQCSVNYPGRGFGVSSLLNVSKMFWEWKPHTFQRTLKPPLKLHFWR